MSRLSPERKSAKQFIQTIRVPHPLAESMKNINTRKGVIVGLGLGLGALVGIVTEIAIEEILSRRYPTGKDYDDL